jgi:hypothetical protein
VSWTQPVCRRCYGEWHPGEQPRRLTPEMSERERCCYCGRETTERIYDRVDPATVPFPMG